MEFSYRVDPASGVLLMEVTGGMEAEGWRRISARLAEDPEVSSGIDQLIDLRRVPRVDVPNGELRAFASRDPHRLRGRMAVVVSSDCVFGVVRMYGLAADLPEDSFRVFRVLEDARLWIGVDAAFQLSAASR